MARAGWDMVGRSVPVARTGLEATWPLHVHCPCYPASRRPRSSLRKKPKVSFLFPVGHPQVLRKCRARKALASAPDRDSEWWGAAAEAAVGHSPTGAGAPPASMHTGGPPLTNKPSVLTGHPRACPGHHLLVLLTQEQPTGSLINEAMNK